MIVVLSLLIRSLLSLSFSFMYIIYYVFTTYTKNIYNILLVMYVYILYEIRIVYLSVELSLFPYTYFMWYSTENRRGFLGFFSLSLYLSLLLHRIKLLGGANRGMHYRCSGTRNFWERGRESVCMQHCTNIIMVVRCWGRRAAEEGAANSILSFLYMYINVNTSSPSRFFSVIIIITSHRRCSQRHPSLYLLSRIFPHFSEKGSKEARENI